MDTTFIDPSHTAITDLTPSPVIPPECINEPLSAAMFDLCRACAVYYDDLPQSVFEAYTDRDHSKFNPLLWQKYLDGLMLAISRKLGTVRKTYPRLYNAYTAVALIQTMQKKVQL